LEKGIHQREDIGIVNSDSALLNYYNYIEQQVNGYEIQDNNEGYYAANNACIDHIIVIPAGIAVRSCQPTDII